MNLGMAAESIHDSARCRAGNFATIFAVAAPVLLGLTGGGVDLVVYSQQQSAMQNAADAAVLAATRAASPVRQNLSEFQLQLDKCASPCGFGPVEND